jgi:NDP-sugar pyrophosphorylase family protein
VAIEYSKESCPLGTAGAVKFASKFLRDEASFLVMNGDSFMETDFKRLLEFHRAHQATASLVVRQVANANRYGSVRVGEQDRVTGFAEKAGGDAPGLVNAGVYVFNREVLEEIPEGQVSLEKDVFPRLLDRGVFALEEHGMFIDIGTPEDYAQAQMIFDRLSAAAAHGQPVQR